ncbi:hypothetical protein ACLOJK_011232 [Asimina triloba]
MKKDNLENTKGAQFLLGEERRRILCRCRSDEENFGEGLLEKNGSRGGCAGRRFKKPLELGQHVRVSYHPDLSGPNPHARDGPADPCSD